MYRDALLKNAGQILASLFGLGVAVGFY